MICTKRKCPSSMKAVRPSQYKLLPLFADRIYFTYPDVKYIFAGYRIEGMTNPYSVFFRRLPGMDAGQSRTPWRRAGTALTDELLRRSPSLCADICRSMRFVAREPFSLQKIFYGQIGQKPIRPAYNGGEYCTERDGQLIRRTFATLADRTILPSVFQKNGMHPTPFVYDCVCPSSPIGHFLIRLRKIKACNSVAIIL